MINPQSFPQHTLACIGLGSNLQNPIQQITMARAAIVALAGVEELSFSSLYQSPPMGPQDQPHYVNAVMAINTLYTPLELLANLQAIENSQGRVRQTQRWVARTLDLDILLYGEQQITSQQLTVPHIGISERAFVLYPLYEILPNLIIPGRGAVEDMINACPLNALERIVV